MVVIEKIDEIFLQIQSDWDVALELKEHFSCYADNYKWSPKFKSGFWDGKISFFNLQNRTLPIGLLPKLIKYFKSFKYKYKFNFDIGDITNFLKDGEIEKFSKHILRDTSFEARQHQLEAVEMAIKNKRGVIRAATASGKSMMIYLTIMYVMIENPSAKILLVVPSTSLVEQMYSDFEKYGMPKIDLVVDKLYTGKKITNKPILISTWQSLQRKPPAFFEKFDGIIVDECHGSKAYEMRLILEKCINAEYRIGYTGTLPEGRSNLYNIFGFLGPKVYDIGSKILMDKGILSKMDIINVKMKYPEDVVKKNKKLDYFEEESFIIKYKKRNKVIKKIIDNIPDGQNTLLLVKRIEHLDLILEYLEDNLDDKFIIENISGKTKPEEREAIRNLMEKEKNVILVATFGTLSTGVSINNLHNVMFASSYKSKIKVLQSIGRGLRTHISKDKVIIWDLVDDMSYKKRTGKMKYNYTYLHWQERLKHYKKEGFEYKNMKIVL